MKKLTKITALLCAVLSFANLAAACGGNDKEKERDATKTYLTVYNYDGGVGTQWLYDSAKRFEALYAEKSLEEGKKGIVVDVVAGKDNLATLAASPNNVFFTEQISFNDMIAKNQLLDISDMAEKPFTDLGLEETGNVVSKIPAETKEALLAQDGKLYALPHYEVYTGVSYDRDLFNTKGLFIQQRAEGQTTTKFCKANATNISVGPDGVKGSYDDGLPSSYEEFYDLVQQMLKLQVTPFIYTGQHATYINHIVTGAWATYTGVDEFRLNVTLDSTADVEEGEDPITTEIITDWNADGTPVVEETTITMATGYKTLAQSGRYYALEFLKTLMSSGPKAGETWAGDGLVFSDLVPTSSHLDAQMHYVFSNLDPYYEKPIGMIIEGSYWYNEAKSALTASEKQFGDDAKNRDFSYMPLPVQINGQVKEGEGKKNTLLDANVSFAFINANIANDPVVSQLAKDFLQFCYSDQELVNFTKETSIFKGVAYNVDKSIFEDSSKFAQHMFEIRQNSDVIRPYAANKIYINAQGSFNYAGTGESWASTVNGTPYKFPREAFRAGLTSKDYFLGMQKSEAEWTGVYGKYFQ